MRKLTKNRSWTVTAPVLIVLVLALGGSCRNAQAGTVYDAVADFSIVSNPNAVWSYGWSATLGSVLNLYTLTDTTCYPGISAWGLYSCNGSFLPAPQVLHNDTDSVIRLPPFPQITLPPNELLLHPGESGQYAVVQWTAPKSGIYQIKALFEGLDSIGPTTTDVHILHYNAATQTTHPLLSGQINSYGEPLTSLIPAVQVSAGDTISFAVGYGVDANYGYDSTGLWARIEFEKSR